MKSNGLTLGVLGGMGPAATAEFMRLLAEKAPATCDQEHPSVIVYSNPLIPNRTDYLLGRGPNPSGYLLEGLNKLLQWGADILAVTCNTSHYYIDSFPIQITKHLVSIIDETIDKSKELSPRGAWLTATLGTMNMGIYQKHATYKNYDFRIPSKELQIEIHKVTDLVKAGNIAEAGVLYKEICSILLDNEDIPIVCACTELPIAYQEAGMPHNKCVSSLEALADGCLRELYKIRNKH